MSMKMILFSHGVARVHHRRYRRAHIHPLTASLRPCSEATGLPFLNVRIGPTHL